MYDNLFCSMARILLREKKGLDADSFNENLQKLVIYDYDSNISKAVCNRAINWLKSAGIRFFAGKVTECKTLDLKARCRCFFTDLGLTRYFLRKIGADNSTIGELCVFRVTAKTRAITGTCIGDAGICHLWRSIAL